MYFLHAINSDRQTRLLNVLGQIAMILGDKKKTFLSELRYRYYTTPSLVVFLPKVQCRRYKRTRHHLSFLNVNLSVYLLFYCSVTR